MDEDSFFELQSTLSQLKSSTSSSYTQQNLAALSETLHQLDQCLRKSNANIIQLKESLKLVLKREAELQNHYNVLVSRYNYSEALAKGKLGHWISRYSLEIEGLKLQLREFDRLEQGLKEQSRAFDVQEQELKRLREYKLNTLAESQEKDKECSQMKMSIERLNGSVKRLDLEGQSWKNRVAKLKREFDEKTIELDDSKSECDLGKKKQLKLQEELRNFSAHYVEIEEETKRNLEDKRQFECEMNEKYDQLKQKYSEIEAERTVLEEKNHELEQEVEKQTLKIEVSQEENRTFGCEMNEKYDQLNQKYDQLNQKYSEIEAKKTVLEEESNELKQEVEKQTQETKVSQEENRTFGCEMNEKYDQLNQKYDQLNRKYSELEAKKTVLEEENHELKQEVEKQTQEIEISQEETRNFKLFAKTTSSEKSDALAQISILELQLNNQSQKLSKNSEHIRELHLKSAKLQEDSEQKDLKISSLHSELETNKESHRTTFESHTEAKNQLLNQLQTKEAQLYRFASQHKLLEEEFSKAKTEYYHYEVTTKKSSSEVLLWKSALLEISCFQSVERPTVEDVLRGLLGVAPERLKNYDPDTKSYIDSIVLRIKEIISTQDLDPTVQRLQKLLEELNERYRREMAERRRLHALLQDLRGNIRVMCRVRPLIHNEKHIIECVQVMDTCKVKVSNPHTRRDNWFEMDRAFNPMDLQEVIYYEVSELILSVMDGFNVCIMAYGQTGSGKTHTMEGDGRNPGINFRAVKEVYDIVDSRAETHCYSISISILEVYNDTIKDLLQPSNKKLEIREDSKGSTHLTGVLVKQVDSYNEIVGDIETGKLNRSVGCTNVNEYSSRSHCIVTLYIQCRISDGSEQLSKLNLIDLAGSERICKSEAEGVRMTEACNINQSLTALGVVLHSLASKDKHIPYRDSKLTHILKDSLSGDAKTLVIVTVSPSPSNVSETISSLSFGSRVAKVEKGKAKIHEKKSRGVFK